MSHYCDVARALRVFTKCFAYTFQPPPPSLRSKRGQQRGGVGGGGGNRNIPRVDLQKKQKQTKLSKHCFLLSFHFRRHCHSSAPEAPSSLSWRLLFNAAAFCSAKPPPKGEKRNWEEAFKTCCLFPPRLHLAFSFHSSKVFGWWGGLIERIQCRRSTMPTHCAEVQVSAEQVAERCCRRNRNGKQVHPIVLEGKSPRGGRPEMRNEPPTSSASSATSNRLAGPRKYA